MLWNFDSLCDILHLDMRALPNMVKKLQTFYFNDPSLKTSIQVSQIQCRFTKPMVLTVS